MKFMDIGLHFATRTIQDYMVCGGTFTEEVLRTIKTTKDGQHNRFDKG